MLPGIVLIAGGAPGSVGAGDPLATITAAAPTAGVTLSSKYAVTANGTSIAVYERLYADLRVFTANVDDPTPAVNGGCVWAQTDGETVVAVTVTGTLTSARVIPSRHSISTSIVGQVVTFTLPRTGHYELQINGSEEAVLYMHPGPAITDAPPSSGGSGVKYYATGNVTKDTGKSIHYFGPGVYTTTGNNRFYLTTNDTVYLADGAVFKGKFVTLNPDVAAVWKTNIRVYGYGVIELSDFNDYGFWLHDVDGLRLENYTVHNPGGFCHKICHIKNGLVDGVKMYGYRTNSDAFDLIAWQDFEFKNFFSRGFDDGICLKSFGHANDTVTGTNPAYPTPLPYTPAEINVTNGWIHDCTVSSDVGNGALEIGYWLACTQVSGILYEDIDILHTYHKAAMGIWRSNELGNPNIHDITYRRIYVEDFHGKWSPGSTDRYHFSLVLVAGSVGRIYDIHYEDIYFTGTTGSFNSEMRAVNASNYIDNIFFSNIWDHGVQITNQAGLNITKANATYITDISVT